MEPKYKWLRVKNTYGEDENLLDKEGKYISWEDDIPEGWRKAFGKQMIRELNDIIEKYNFVEEYTILQIKEKFGGLRWYDSGIKVEASEEYYNWLEKYEILSEQTCIICGKPATHMTKGWILPKCDSCGE